MDLNTIKLIYLFYDSMYESDDEWKIGLNDFVDYIVNDLFEDELFSGMLLEDTKQKISDIQTQLSDAAKKLKGDNYSRVILSVKNLDEMDNIENFYDKLSSDLDKTMDCGWNHLSLLSGGKTGNLYEYC